MNFIIIIFTIFLSFIILFILFWKFIFLRNPARVIPKGNNIVSSADGKIIDIIKFDGKKEFTFFKGNKRYLGIVKTLTNDVSKKGYLISIFMNPLNVHYNRSPISGKIISIKHTKGRFLPVNTIEAGLVNDKTEILINGDIKIKVIQIAGLLASKIITYAKKGQYLKKGETFGLINLGSQVTLITNENILIKAKKGDKVIAGETIIAEYMTKKQ